MDSQILDSLEEILQNSLGMEDSIRWEKYHRKGEAQEENVLQHSYKTSLLAAIVLANEKRYSLAAFDESLVLKAAIVHDLGEIEKGDVVWIDKTDEHEKQEYDFFQNFISGLPYYIQTDLDTAYNLQNADKDGFKDSFPWQINYFQERRLFQAIESLGYLIFAYRQFKRDNNDKILVHVLRNQKDRLSNLADYLPGFKKTFYTPEMHKSIEQFLAKYDGRYIEQKGE